MKRRSTCGLCDNFGVIDVPGQPVWLKKCPECDTDPGMIGLTLAQIVGPPEDGEKEWYAEQERKRLEARRAEEAAFLASIPPEEVERICREAEGRP